MSEKQQTVTRSDFDVQGLPVSRMARIWFLWKCFPYGIAGQGPSIKEVVILWAQHRFGQRWIDYKAQRKKNV